MRDAMRRYYDGEPGDGKPADVSIVVTDWELIQNTPQGSTNWNDYLVKVTRDATPAGKVVDEMMVTKCTDKPQYIVELWLEDE